MHDSKSLNVTGMGGKISHAISFTDVLSNTFHQFAPAYHDYTLYAAGEEGGKSGKNGAKGNGKKKPYRMKTYVFKDLESVQESGPPGERGPGEGSGLMMMPGGHGRQRGDSILHRDSIADNALLMFDVGQQQQQQREEVEAGGGAGGDAGEPAIVPSSIIREEEEESVAEGEKGDLEDLGGE